MALLEDYLYSEEFLFEGEQAEKYLEKKKQNADKNLADENERYINRHRGSKRDELGRGTKRNPAFDTARKIDIQRRYDKDTVPKNKTSSEKKLEKARKKEYAADNYAYDIADKADSQGHTYQQIGSAYDAANRHYRRTHRNESAEVKLYEGAIDLI